MTPLRAGERIAVRGEDGEILFFEPDQIFYLESSGHDTRIRTARRTAYRSTQRISQLAAQLPTPPFFRCHERYIIHLGRIRSLRRRGKNNYELRLDPPVNKLIPLSRHRVAEFRKLMGVP